VLPAGVTSGVTSGVAPLPEAVPKEAAPAEWQEPVSEEDIDQSFLELHLPVGALAQSLGQFVESA